MYYFYILYSSKADKYYIGHTSDIEGRLRRHNTDHKGFTGKFDDWRTKYIEAYATKEDAYAREREVKSWKNRRMLKRLIQDTGQSTGEGEN